MTWASAASCARLVVVIGQPLVAVEEPAHLGSPRSSASSHSGREGRSIRFMSASAGEQCPSTMARTCSAIGISTPCGLGQPDQRPGTLDALGHHVHPADDLLERLPLPESEAHRPVPALRAGTGRHQVTDAGQATEGEHLAAEGDAQPPQLGQAPRDEHGAGVVPETQPVTDPGGDGHHVLGGAGDLTPDDVGAHIGTERARVHQPLHAARQRLVGEGDHAGRRVALRHLAGQVRTGQHAGGHPRQHLGHHLGHAQVGPHLDSLGQAHHGLDPPRQTEPCR